MIASGTDLFALPQMPKWVTVAKSATAQEVPFLSGAALSRLDLLMDDQHVPLRLIGARLALLSAETCLGHMGRSERAGDLRDAIAFLQPGDHPGPAGEVYLAWDRGVAQPLSIKGLQRALPTTDADQIAVWLSGVTGGPLIQAATILENAMVAHPRDPNIALLLADVGLSRALNWPRLLPLLAVGLRRADLRKRGQDLVLACHRAVVTAAFDVLRLAADMSRRASRLHAVAPKLRAKGSDAAVGLILMRDAVAPTALTSLRSDRAARRFCDRLVTLGVARELTGRDTFRLYGL